MVTAWNELERRFGQALSAYEKLPSFEQYYPTLGSPSRATVGLRFRQQAPGASREYLNFASSNYLNLNQRPEVRAAYIEALDRYGAGSNGSPTLSGYYEPHRALESELAQLHDAEDAVLFSSGYCANLSAIAACLGPADLVVVDERIHGSILDAGKLAQTKLRSFKHNDVGDLDSVMRRLRSSSEIALVATMGVFSMSGDIGQVAEIAACARRHDALVLCDDAHAVGVLGDRGRGSLDHFGLSPSAVDLSVGTLSKTFGGIGGYIAGSRRLTEHMRFAARAHVLSAAIPPATAAGCAAAVRILASEGAELSRRLRSRTELFTSELERRGIATLGTGAGVAAIAVKDAESLWASTRYLFSQGIFFNPVLYPAVRKDEGRLRFYLNIAHGDDVLAHVAELTAEALQKFAAAPRTALAAPALRCAGSEGAQ